MAHPDGARLGEPKLIVIVKPGKEERVARDVLDALYPYDEGVAARPFKGLVVVYSRLEANLLLETLRAFPIRGVLALRGVEGALRTLPTGEEAFRQLLETLGRDRLRGVKVEVRTRGYIEREKVRRLLMDAGLSSGTKTSKRDVLRVEFTEDYIFYYHIRRGGDAQPHPQTKD